MGQSQIVTAPLLYLRTEDTIEIIIIIMIIIIIENFYTALFFD